MSELQVFQYETNEVRLIEQQDGPWWVLKDVCDALGISKYRDTASRLERDERGSARLDTPGGPQDMTIINEPGLYNVILRSDKPEAKKFKRWVTHEVLPTLRRTGTYSANPEKKALAEAKLNNSRARVSSVWLKLAQQVDVPEYKLICASYASNVLAGREVIPLPAAEEKLYSAGEVGEMLGVSGQRIGKTANRHGLKTPEYGKLVWDKSPYSPKQVQTFMYNHQAIEKLKELL